MGRECMAAVGYPVRGFDQYSKSTAIKRKKTRSKPKSLKQSKSEQNISDSRKPPTGHNRVMIDACK